ncbi:hypothetical protein F4814DRAFT_454531 [Daldinia grandis]|nr:hypothetical protein F4814DRAFT_454531 [Daldinia grandis]
MSDADDSVSSGRVGDPSNATIPSRAPFSAVYTIDSPYQPPMAPTSNNVSEPGEQADITTSEISDESAGVGDRNIPPIYFIRNTLDKPVRKACFDLERFAKILGEHLARKPVSGPVSNKVSESAEDDNIAEQAKNGIQSAHASKLEYKHVNELWDPKAGAYKIVKSVHSKFDELDEYAFVVRQRTDNPENNVLPGYQVHISAGYPKRDLP